MVFNPFLATGQGLLSLGVAVFLFVALLGGGFNLAAASKKRSDMALGVLLCISSVLVFVVVFAFWETVFSRF